MGPLSLPTGSLVCVDSCIIIYEVERAEPYASSLALFWGDVVQGRISAIASELVVMETLVGPMRTHNERMIRVYEEVLHSPQLRLVGIDAAVLREAARLRAEIPALRTPDAIHAATAILERADLFLTNDLGYRRVPGLATTMIGV